MKVALVTSSLSRRGGGVSEVVQGLSRALSKRQDIDIRVFGLVDQDWIERDSMDWAGADPTALRVIGPASIGYAPKMLSALLKWNPDIVHVHGLWMHPSRVVLQWHKRTGGSYIVSPHGMLDPWAVRNSAWKKSIARIAFEDEHWRCAGAFHALCVAEADAIRSIGLHNPIAVVPNGIEELELPVDDDPPWHKLLGPGRKVLLYLGRLHPKKNVHGLIEAFCNLTELGGGDDWSLVIAGTGERDYCDLLHSIGIACGAPQRIVFAGGLRGRAKAAALKNATAFILPSFSEGLPMAILEAWANKLPVAATWECNLPEGFDVGASFRIDAHVEALKSQLGLFLRLSERELLEMGQRGFELAKTKFCWDKVAEDMCSLYVRTLRKRV